MYGLLEIRFIKRYVPLVSGVVAAAVEQETINGTTG